MTFAQLTRRSQELGGFLRRAGVTRDSRVGVFMEPSLDLMTNIRGILWAGGSYVPLSPEYPEERIAYMMADAGVEIVLTQELLRPALQEMSPAGIRTVTLDEVFPAPEFQATTAEPLPPLPAPRRRGHPRAARPRLRP
ncbi:AMP-binding protein [Streptomyces turgidiscabies]|uniref:AMP-binding protein n=1 Tax=Streptomyces turgidiscabies TaxID=85558 RepID=UPI0027D850E2|nr:AMP-binding protein [Streptomyces turgidiscabies]